MTTPTEPQSTDTEEQRSKRVVFFTLIALLLVILGLVLLVFWRFLIMLGLATALSLLLTPMHRRLTRWMRGRDWLSALGIVLVTTLVILVPVLGVLATIAGQALGFYQWVAPQLTTVALEQWWNLHVQSHLPWIAKIQEIGEGRVADFLAGALTQLAKAANNLLQGAVAGLTSAAFELGLLLIMLYFFLRDGDQFRAQIHRVSPLSREQADGVMDQVAQTMKGALASLLLVPLVQGTLAMLGYWALGVPNALLWGGLTTLVAFIPLIGTPLVWVPICIFLAVNGQIWQTVALAIYCTAIVGTIDNVIRPWMLRGSANIHPLWSFLAILGGLVSFGAVGLLVGPLILSLGVSALHIYDMDVLRGGGAARGGMRGRAGTHASAAERSTGKTKERT
jgi:predicted PurR-regulated permease PerM